MQIAIEALTERFVAIIAQERVDPLVHNPNVLFDIRLLRESLATAFYRTFERVRS